MSEVYIVGSEELPTTIQAINDDGESAPLSAKKDESGKSVLRVVDAAPFAYDHVNDKIKTSTKKENSTKLEQVFNGSIGANTDIFFDVEFSGEDEVWVMVQTNQQPWRLRAGSLTNLVGAFDESFFPKIAVPQNTTHSSAAPATALFLPMSIAAGTGLIAPTSISEAKQYPLSPGENAFRFRYYNQAAVNASVTISVLRVWK